MSEKRTRVDWDALEPHYRAGIRSLKDMGKEFGCSDAGIIKHAREHGWVRNLKAKIQERAEVKVSAALVRAETGEAKPLTEALRVEVESEVQARVRLEHRTDITRSKRIVNKLLQALESLGIAETAPPVAEGQKAAPVAPLKEHAANLQKLVDTQRSLMSMEREAYGIAQMVETPEDLTPINPLEGARRLAFALRQAAEMEASS